MKLILGNKYSLISECDKNLKRALKKELTILDQSSCFGGGGFDIAKAKKIKFFVEKDKNFIFRSGLLYEVVRVIRACNAKIEIEDQRVRADYQDKKFSDEELRTYFNPNFKYVAHQIRALKALLSHGNGIISATTSAGKSSIMLAFMKIINKKCLILVPKEDLGRQLVEGFNEGGFPVKFISGKIHRKIDKNASYVSTIGCAKKLPNDFDVILMDECHRASSNVYQEYLSSSSTKYIYGFSATPEGNAEIDFMRVKQFSGNIIEKIEAKELLANKVIAFPDIKMIEIHQIPTMSWPAANDLCIVRNENRNNLIKEIAEKENDQTLILIRTIEHGEILANLIDGSVFVNGTKTSEERKEAIEDFKSGKIKYLIASNIFNEGISINNIKVLIIASGGKSRIESTQKLGRILRIDRKTGKVSGKVFDFMDLGNKFTEKHSKLRSSIYKKVGFPVKIIKT